MIIEEKRKNMLIEKTRMIKEYQRKVEEAQKYLEDLTVKKKELEKKVRNYCIISFKPNVVDL